MFEFELRVVSLTDKDIKYLEDLFKDFKSEAEIDSRFKVICDYLNKNVEYYKSVFRNEYTIRQIGNTNLSVSRAWMEYLENNKDKGMPILIRNFYKDVRNKWIVADKKIYFFNILEEMYNFIHDNTFSSLEEFNESFRELGRWVFRWTMLLTVREYGEYV